MLVVWRQEREKERKVLQQRGLTDGKVLRVLTPQDQQDQQGKMEEEEVADVWEEEEEQERHLRR
jgi:hypothetical protein